jgi:sarcosine oxidase subunit delta
MLMIPCPYCSQMRPEREFRYCGEAGLVRPADPAAASDRAWTDYLFARGNAKGESEERWRHLYGCGRFFLLRRNTRDDSILEAQTFSEGPS